MRMQSADADVEGVLGAHAGRQLTTCASEGPCHRRRGRWVRSQPAGSRAFQAAWLVRATISRDSL